MSKRNIRQAFSDLCPYTSIKKNFDSVEGLLKAVENKYGIKI